MGQAILISNNETINSLYEVNLRAYVATNVTIRESLKAAKELLDHDININMIICFRELDNKANALSKFIEYLKERKLSIPIIVLGEPGTQFDNCIIINNKYDIKSLLKAAAKLLEVTADQMASRAVPQYFPIPLKLFIEMKCSHCDIYFRTQKEDFNYDYFKILEKETDFENSLEKFISDGVEHLYIDAAQRLRFIDKASSMIVGELSRDDLTTSERVEITQQGMGMVAEDIFESEEISKEIAAISKACIESITTIVSEVPKLKNLLVMLIENKSDYCYKHSVISTFIAYEIIDNISWGNAEQQSKVAFALFFHDIYLVPLYKKYPQIRDEEDFIFSDDVDPDDKEIVLSHAHKAGHLVKSFPRCPLGADMIIAQHHGATNGLGFAVQFRDDISPLAKVMMIAEDAAVAIMKKLDVKEKMNKEEIADELDRKYQKKSYQKIIQAFRESKL